MGCQDHYGVETDGGMCRISSFAYQGLTTDANGVLQTGDYRGEEVNQGTSTLSMPIAQVPNSTIYAREDVTHVRELFGAAAGSGDVFLDGSRSQRGVMCVNISREQQTRDVITRLLAMSSDDRRTLFPENTDAKFTALLETLQTQYESAYHKEPPLSTGQSVWRSWGRSALIGLSGIGAGIAVFGIGGLVAAWMTHRWGPRGPGGPQGPTGGTPVGGGGGGTAPAPEAVQAHRSMLESSTFWSGVGAFAAAAGVMLLLRGRVREGEVREGADVRTPEMRFRDLATRVFEPRAPRAEVRETASGNGGFNIFDIMEAQPVPAH